jgi:hypothetical protein
VFNALTKLEGVEPHPSEGNFILMSVAASGRTNDEIIRLAQVAGLADPDDGLLKAVIRP